MYQIKVIKRKVVTSPVTAYYPQRIKGVFVIASTSASFPNIFKHLSKITVRHSGLVGRAEALQLAGPGSIRKFNFCPGTGCVSPVCVVFCVVSGGGYDIVSTIRSV